MKILSLSISELIEKFKSGELLPSFLIKKVFNRIEECREYNVFTSIDYKNSMRLALESDKRYKNGQQFFLDGIPISIKDNICVKGMKCTASSKMLENFISPYDATIVQKLKQNGAIIVGKTNCDEFGMGSTNENSIFGAVKNPYNKEYVAGGSSGGGAASVALSIVPAGIGSDSGGSVRLPSSFCNVFGLRPSYGAVSRFGLISYASSFDQIGFMARNPEDISILMDIVSGIDEKDSTSRKINFDKRLKKKLIIATPIDIVEDIDREVYKKFIDILEILTDLNCDILDVEMKNNKFALPSYYVISSSEASSNLSRYDGIRYGTSFKSVETADMYNKIRSNCFGFEVKLRILMGIFSLYKGFENNYYEKAQLARNLIKEEFNSIFEWADFIITPTSPQLPPKIGENSTLENYKLDKFTISAPLASLPSISFPAGFSENNLPIGLQITGRVGSEYELLLLAEKIYNKIH